MLQDTGHAEGVPIATPRGRSVEVPFGRESTVLWYNNYTHYRKKETRNLERKWRKTNLEVFRIAWKNSISSYRQALRAARTEHIRKLIDNQQITGPFQIFSLCQNL